MSVGGRHRLRGGWWMRRSQRGPLSWSRLHRGRLILHARARVYRIRVLLRRGMVTVLRRQLGRIRQGSPEKRRRREMGMLGGGCIGSRRDRIHRRSRVVRVAVHSLRQRRLTVETSPILVMCLRRRHGRGRIRLRRLVYGGVGAVHWCGCGHQFRGFWNCSVSVYPYTKTKQ